DLACVMKVLEPIWTTKTETASRVRGRIERILDWASVHGFRQGENPARWRGRLDHLLPAPAKVKRIEHHAALPYREIGPFMTALRQPAPVGFLELTRAIAAAVKEWFGTSWVSPMSKSDVKAEAAKERHDKTRRDRRWKVTRYFHVRALRSGRLNAFVLKDGKPQRIDASFLRQ